MEYLLSSSINYYNDIMSYYKHSLYNSVIRISKQRSILYNAVVDKFCILSNDQLYSYNNINLTSVKSISFIEELFKEGFLVHSDKSEIEELIKKIRDIDSRKDIMQLIINPTMDCNLRCWYCYEKHLNNSRVDTWVKDSIVKLIKNEIETNSQLKQINTSFFGGEPFLYFHEDIYPLMRQIKQICQEYDLLSPFAFTTNGVLVDKYVQQKLSEIGDCSFQITLDGSRRHHNSVRIRRKGEETFDTILGNVSSLLSRGFSVLLRINITNRNIVDIEELIEELLTIPEEYRSLCRIDFQPVWQEDINEKLLDGIQEFANTLSTKHSFQTTYAHRHRMLSPCYAESDYEVLVNYNGDLFRCSARDFTTNNRDGVLLPSGELKWDQIKREMRRKSVLSSETCKSCRIAPLCGGGCSQIRIEHFGYDGCIYGYSDKEKDDLILSRFENLYVRSTESKCQ